MADFDPTDPQDLLDMAMTGQVAPAAAQPQPNFFDRFEGAAAPVTDAGVNFFDQFEGAAPEGGGRLSPGPRPGLVERFEINAEAGFRTGTSTGAAADWANAGRSDSRARFDRAYAAFPQWETPLEGLASFSGQVVGSLPAVENLVPIGLGARFAGLFAGRVGTTTARVMAGAVDAGVTNAAVDPLIQALEINAGFRGDYDPYQTATAAVVGAAAGGAIPIAGKAIDAGVTRLGTAINDGAARVADGRAREVNSQAGLDGSARPAPSPNPPEIPEGSPAGPLPGERVVIDDAAPATGEGPHHGAAGIVSGVGDDGAAVRVDLDEGGAVLARPGQLVPDRTASAAPDLRGVDYDIMAVPELDQAAAIARLQAEGDEVDRALVMTAERLRSIRSDIDALTQLRETGEVGPDGSALLDRATPAGVYAGRLSDGIDLGGGRESYTVAERAAMVKDLAARADALAADIKARRPSPDDVAKANMLIPPVDRAVADVAAPTGPRAIGDELAIAGDARQGVAAATARPMRGATGAKARPAASPADGAADGAAKAVAGQAADQADAAAPLFALGSQHAHALGRTPKAGADFTRLADVMEALRTAIDPAAVRQGRLGRAPKGTVLGQFGPRTGVVRLKNVQDFETFVHELGHDISARVPGVRGLAATHAGELSQMAYPLAAPAVKVEEGLAEFIRLWVTNRPAAMREAPAFARAFDAMMRGAHGEIATALDAARDGYAAFLTQSSRDAVVSTIRTSKRDSWLGRTAKDLRKYGIADTIADRLHQAYSFLLDDLHPINRAVRGIARVYKERTGQALDVEVANDAYKLARLARGARNAGHMDLMHGVHAYRSGDVVSASLRDAIIEATGARNVFGGFDGAAVTDFGAYLWSRRAYYEFERFAAGEIPNPPDKLTQADHLANIRDMEAAHPAFRSAAAKVHDWTRALWAKKRDAGLITQEQYLEGLQIVDYVPGLRHFDDDEKIAPGRIGRDGSGAMVRRFRGSDRDVINPLESLMADAYRTAEEIARNDAIRALARMADRVGIGAGRFAERVPTETLKALRLDPDEVVTAAAKAAGFSAADIVLIRADLDALLGDTKATIFRPAKIVDGQPVVLYREGGQIKGLHLADGELGAEMVAAFNAMTRSEGHLFTAMLAKPAAVLRMGITTHPSFLLANFLRDQTVAAIYFGEPLRRLKSTMLGMRDEVFARDAARSYNAFGGIMGGQETASLRDGAVNRDLDALRQKGFAARRLTSLKGVLELTELSETGTRLGLYGDFYRAAKARGLADFEALTEAAWRARDYMDFDRRGSGMAALARVIPFLNAAWQGLDKTGRMTLGALVKDGALTEDGAMRADAVAIFGRLAMLGMAGMALHALMSEDPDYAEISPTTRATHWMIKWGDSWLAVPKPFELASVLNLFEAGYDGLVRSDPTAAARYREGLVTVVAPPSVAEGNPLVKYWFERRTNTNLFTGRDLIPADLAALEPWLQYTYATSMFGRQLADVSGTSPILVDHAVTSFGGSWGRSLLSLYDVASGEKPDKGWMDAIFTRRFQKDASRASTSVAAMWGLVAQQTGDWERQAQSWQVLAKVNDVRAADLMARWDAQTRAYVTASVLPADVKRMVPILRAREAVQAINAVRRDMLGDRLKGADGALAVRKVEKTAADDILSDLAMAEARNALVVMGVPGFGGVRAPIPTDSYWRELRAAAPNVATALADLYATRKVAPADIVHRQWPEVQKRLNADGTQARLADLIGRHKAAGADQKGRKIPRAAKPGVPGLDPDTDD